MKFTLTRISKDQQLHLSTKTMESLLERISKDNAKGTIAKFRNTVSDNGIQLMGLDMQNSWLRIYPAGVFEKDANNNLILKHANGILLLTFENIMQEDGITGVKNVVSIFPSTFAAIEGADGKSIHILVRYCSKTQDSPLEENEAERLYQSAYRQIMPIYQSTIKADICSTAPSLQNHFLMTMDNTPYYNSKAVAFQINPNLGNLTDTGTHIEKTDSITTQESRSIKDKIASMMEHLNAHYEMRYNSVMKYTEYQEKDRAWLGFMPVSPRIVKRMTLEVQLADIPVSIKDVKNYLESDYIKNYDPIDEYLFACHGKWDGKDHIRALARTVPTGNPNWEDWFYTWFLGMVEQWRTYRNHQYGNSVVPLLISKQGYNKSTFCRRLLPQELQWGYNDNLILSEKRQVLQAMSQFLLINLDEFNQISANVQQGFLKNIIQLPTVKIKRPYGSHVEDFPRTASFIGTSNIDDVPQFGIKSLSQKLS